MSSIIYSGEHNSLLKPKLYQLSADFCLMDSPRGEGDKNVRLPSPWGRRVGDEGKPTNTPQPMICYLDNQVVPYINSSLKAEIDVTQAIRLKVNLNQCFQGVIPVGKGFYITEQVAQDWIKADSKNQDVLKPSCSAGDLTDSLMRASNRWIIDFQDMSIEEVTAYKLPINHIRATVKPERENNRETVMREKWWRFKRTNEAMRRALLPLHHYFAVPGHSKWFIFVPIDSNWLPNNSTAVVVSEDF